MLIICFIIGPGLYTYGCGGGGSDADSDGGSPANLPDFNANGIGENLDIVLAINILASREDGSVSGGGTMILDGELYDIDVVDASLSTDLGKEPPIPQTDDLSPFEFVCTPRYADLSVRINPGGHMTDIRLNECEKNNSQIFESGGVVTNPCNNNEVVSNTQFFNGPCLSMPQIGVEFGKDSLVIGEFDGRCTNESPCVVPRDVLILVPSFDREF